MTRPTKTAGARSLRCMLIAGASAAAMSSTAFAQGGAASSDTAEAPRDEVVVTGSRLRRQGIDSSVNVTVIDSKEFEQRGYTNAIDALEQQPIFGSGTNLDGADIANNDFTANADILDLGTNRTLTLINGRRFVSSNQATVFVPGNSNGAQVDLSLINPVLIDRTEVIVGSSGGATYGADAVGGVVNIILKDDFEGLEISGLGGFTQQGDGGNYRLAAVAGKNFFNNRANLTASFEYFNTDEVTNAGDNRLEDLDFAGFNNPLASSNPRAGIPSTLILPGASLTFSSPNGILLRGPTLGVVTTAPFFPNTLASLGGNAALGTAFNNFVAATGATPFAFAQTPAGQAVNPLLFAGTFSGPGSFLTVNNTDPATSAFLPRLAVPLQFAPGGNLVPFNVGNISPPNPAQQTLVIGGDGLPAAEFTSLRAEQERFAGTILSRFNVTDTITHKGEYFYSHVESRNVNNFLNNIPNGSTTAGSFSVPIFVDQNPFLSQQARDTINALSAQGLTIPTVAGQRALFLARSYTDITGPVDEASVSDFFRITQSLEGELQFANRNFNWDIAFAYGRNNIDNTDDQLFDVEFALATDVVTGANGQPVCRQQTLAAPEPIAVRAPNLGSINTGLPVPVTPTAAQVAACVPLNLLGVGAPSQAAIDYVTTATESNNLSQQYLGAAQFGGELFELPAGPILFSTQFEWRRESNRFTPGSTFGLGLGRNTLGQGSDGFLRFFEGGTEISVPIFGRGAQAFLFEKLELNGAFRFVNRSGLGGLITERSGATDLTFSAGGTWSPISSVSLRGNRSRSVRSPSVVELFGAGVTGFSGALRGNNNPCDVDSIAGGPAGGIRRTNCETFRAQLGLPANFLSTFQAPGGNAPAAGASNPNLRNEQSDTWTVGVTWKPEFIDGLAISADYYALDLDEEIQLLSLASECFDQAAFPNSVVDGIFVCDAVVFAQPQSPGSSVFVVPSINPITGRPVNPVANPGTLAQDQAPFTSTFTFFNTANLSATELRSLNLNVSYNFELQKLFGGVAANWGDITLNGTGYYLRRLDQSFTGTFLDTNPEAGEDGDPKFDTRLDLTHNWKGLTHSVQWFRTEGTDNNVLIETATFGSQSAAFSLPTFNQFNYNFSYEINDNFTFRFIVNNFLNNRLDEAAGLSNNPGAGQGDVLGRRFVLGVTGRF